MKTKKENQAYQSVPCRCNGSFRFNCFPFGTGSL